MVNVFRIVFTIGFFISLSLFIPESLYAFDNGIPVYKIESIQESYNLNSKLEIHADSTNLLTIDSFQDSIDFLNFHSFKPGKQFNPAYDHWVRLKLTLAEDLGIQLNNWYLFVGKADFFELYLLNKDRQLIYTEKGGTLLPSREKTLKRGNQVRRIPISLIAGKEYIAYIRYSRINKQEIDVNVQLRKFDFYQTWEYIQASRRDWLFLGFILAMIVLNLLYYFISKSRDFLYHGLFISGVFLFVLDFFGVTPDLWFVRDHPKLIQLIDYIALAMIDIGYFLFIKEYLVFNQSAVKWNQLFRRIVQFKILFFISVILLHYTTYNEPLADKLLSLFIALGFTFTIGFLIWFPEKSRKQYFLLAGTLFLFVAVCLNAVSIILGKGLLTLFTEIGLAAEIIVFSIALASRRARLIKEEQQAKSLVEMDAFKNKFYTNITHEFRTPLTIINGMTEMAKEKISSLDTASIFDSLTKIRTQSNLVLNLVNQMLDLSKLETHSLKFTFEQKNLIELLQSIVSEFRVLAMHKELDLSLQTDLEECFLDMDEQYLRSVISNLISNAIKFTEPTGSVRIICEHIISKEQETVKIKVIDTGKGMTPSQMEKIFDRFYQIESNQYTGGTGVGLALSKELIQLMNGMITVQSEVGKGTCFELSLPVTHEKTKVELSLSSNVSSKALLAEEFPYALSADLPIILLVDDNDEILLYLEAILEKDFKIVKTKNGLEGVQKAEEIIPDLIISDVMMPLKDGFELCNDLKSNEKTNHIPIILLTAVTEYEGRIKGWKTGADVYLTKPFSKEELFIQIHKLNEQNRRLQEKYSQFMFIENKAELKKENSFIHDIHSLLDKHLADPEFSVEQLAQSLFMSRMQLHRKIKALSDKSASHYIRSYRLHKAKVSLKDFDQSIGNVAYEVGFQDPSYFSKSFLQEFGISPSDYRESLK